MQTLMLCMKSSFPLWMVLFCLSFSTISSNTIYSRWRDSRDSFPEVSSVNASLTFTETNELGNCQTQEGKKGKCMPLNDCPELLHFIKQRRGIHTPGTAHYVKGRICRLKKAKTIVCCIPLTIKVRSPSAPLPSIIPSEDQCGLSFRARVSKGRKFEHGAYPWLVGVGYYGVESPFVVGCGGTLITKRHVLTAAHCFHREPTRDPVPNYTHVILGEHSLERDDEKQRPIVLGIAERKNPGYNSSKHYHDISLLVLEKDVRFSLYVRPVCLPFGLNGKDFDLENSEAIIIGWGKMYWGDRSKPDEPFETNVSFVPKERCREVYKIVPQVSLDETQICFGDERDACRGDSGGPLMYKKDYKYYLLGIIAFGLLGECGNPAYPGVYTYVPQYLGWITRNV